MTIEEEPVAWRTFRMSQEEVALTRRGRNGLALKQLLDALGLEAMPATGGVLVYKNNPPIAIVSARDTERSPADFHATCNSRGALTRGCLRLESGDRLPIGLYCGEKTELPMVRAYLKPRIDYLRRLAKGAEGKTSSIGKPLRRKQRSTVSRVALVRVRNW